MTSWPFDSRRYARPHQAGAARVNLRTIAPKHFATSARPMGAPGWPELTFLDGIMEKGTNSVRGRGGWA